MKRWFILLFLLLSFPAAAQQELEIIQLRNRTVDQIVPVLSPLVEPGGSVSGMNDQIIIRASRRNITQLREVLATLDTAPRNLVIRVSNDISQESEKEGAALSGRIELGQGGNTRIRGRAYDTVSTGSQNTSQRIQVMEGGSGYIMVGRSVPLPFRQVVLGPNGVVVSESLIYRDIGSGLYVTPRLAGDRVTLEISPQFERERGRQGGADIQRLSTMVSGKLGEWIELGGSNQDESVRERGYTSYANTRGRDSRSIWLKVEEIK
jgi:type II secretory pathway component GspD/PulD (secretin)